MDIKPVEKSGTLDVNMTVEALSLPGADRKDQLSHEPGNGLRLAKLDDYREAIVEPKPLRRLLAGARVGGGRREEHRRRPVRVCHGIHRGRRRPASLDSGPHQPARPGNSARATIFRSAGCTARCGRSPRRTKSSWILTAIAAGYGMARTCGAASRCRSDTLWRAWETCAGRATPGSRNRNRFADFITTEYDGLVTPLTG